MSALGLAKVLLQQANDAEAAPLVQELLDLKVESMIGRRSYFVEYSAQLSEQMTARQRLEEAEIFARKAAQLGREHLSASDPLLAIAYLSGGLCLLECGKYDEAETDLLEARRIFWESGSLRDKQRERCERQLVRLYEAWEKPNKAALWRGWLEPAAGKTLMLIRSDVRDALARYRGNTGHYPSTAEGGLRALLEKPKDEKVAEAWSGPYLHETTALKDAWGHDLIYVAHGKHHEYSYDLSSPGKNGIPGDEDDITNW